MRVSQVVAEQLKSELHSAVARAQHFQEQVLQSRRAADEFRLVAGDQETRVRYLQEQMRSQAEELQQAQDSVLHVEQGTIGQFMAQRALETAEEQSEMIRNEYAQAVAAHQSQSTVLSRRDAELSSLQQGESTAFEQLEDEVAVARNLSQSLFEAESYGSSEQRLARRALVFSRRQAEAQAVSEQNLEQCRRDLLAYASSWIVVKMLCAKKRRLHQLLKSVLLRVFVLTLNSCHQRLIKLWLHCVVR